MPYILAPGSGSALGLAGEKVQDQRPGLIRPAVMRHGRPAIAQTFGKPDMQNPPSVEESPCRQARAADRQEGVSGRLTGNANRLRSASPQGAATVVIGANNQFSR